ncbi:8b93a3d3-bc37-4385-9829-e4274e3280da [Sclerotinia trifoliorum]|uniref:8b93a3d3-bc37-4385-9829-e4274e3280da n=1 Tax=Sclerotinia trifoliorum TaxID=28548 RepID=A0A8H2VQB5_9HELO|nr:8b93a3d3-bc37-4385-9829-e4274e3280da [Sclerotinia trifoliorum]
MKLKLILFPSLLLNIHRANCVRRHDDPTMSAPAAVLQQNPGCALVSSTLFACESITPGFTSLLPSAQASCLCYSSSTWIPTVFDKAVQTCANFASTAVPDAYPAFVNLEGFCGNIGNIKTARSSIASASTISKPFVPTFTISAIPACYTAFSLIQFCVALIPGFIALNPTQQASCLCYTSITSWVPKPFDNAVETCSQHAQSVSAFAGLVSSVKIFDGICESVGDILTIGGGLSATVISSNLITSPEVNTAPSTTTIPPSPANPPRTETSVLSTIVIRSSFRNTHSIVKTVSITTSESIVSTTSTAGLGGIGANRGEDERAGDIGDPMVVLISFVCAVLMLFLC